MYDFFAALRMVLRKPWIGLSPWAGRLAVLVGCLVLALALTTAAWKVAEYLVVGLGQGPKEVPQVVQILLSAMTLVPVLYGALRFPRLLRDQRKAKQYQAWQAIGSARGVPGDGGRKSALEDLNADRVSLEGVDLSGNAHLPCLNVPQAILIRANLQGAMLKQADFRFADLTEANLEGSDLEMAKLRGAMLYRANLQGVNLGAADLDGTLLQESNLANANLISVNLRRAVLLAANLKESRLDHADWTTQTWREQTSPRPTSIWPTCAERFSEAHGSMQRRI
jgi:hypothetical protein